MSLALPASFAQERLWFLTQLRPDLGVYNIGFPVPLVADVDVARLRTALRKLVERHETMRTALSLQDGRLVQIVQETVPIDLPETSLLVAPAGEAWDEAWRLLAAGCAEPFDLERAPLWRVRLIRLPGTSLLGFAVHHAICDASSVSNLITELLELDRAAAQGRRPRLPELPIQYADFAAWQRDQHANGAFGTQLAYWRDQLANLPPEIGLPTDRSRPDRPSHRGADVAFRVPAADHEAVRELARSAGATPYAVLLAAFVAVLHRLSGQHDVVVGSPVAGRPLPELQPLLGMFVNTLVLRTDCRGNPTFRELVGRTAETLWNALDHADVPFDRLVQDLAPDRDPGRSPLYQVVLNLIPTVASAQVGNGTAKVDLILDLAADGDGSLHGRLEYATDLFEPATAAAMTQRFGRLLHAALTEPDTPLDRLPLLLDGEHQRLVAAARPSGPGAAPDELAVDRFRRIAAAQPDVVAVCDSAGGRLTYGQLYARAMSLANRLLALGAGPERPVAVLFDNSVELAVAVFGVLATGSPYLPLDTEHPPDRLRHLLADAGAGSIVTTSRLAARLAVGGPPVVCLDDAPAEDRSARVTVPVQPEALAYVIYTSGSTGRPKGVGVTHRNLAAYLAGLAALLDHPDRPVWTMPQPLTFDFSVTAFFGALTSGGTLHLVGRELATDAGWISEHLRRDSVDYLKVTPSHLAALTDGRPGLGELRPRRALILGGEASRWDWFRELRAAGTAVVNHYGPTETTVGVLALPAGREAHPAGGVTPIGWPMSHAEAYVLDERGEPVPDGVVGELCIGGATVARGYLGQPGPTADRFVPDPFSGRPGARLYRTGDRARRLHGGAVEFLGRFDDQVKVRGYRVELGEVRHALLAHPDVADCAVVARPTGPDPDDALELVAYLVPAAGRRPDLDGVGGHLAERLPDYMQPTAMTVLGELPLTPHGKLDRSRLPDIHAKRADGGGDEPAGEFEDLIATLFRQLLRRDRIGRNDNFFAIGGHSLLAIKLITRLRRTFGATVPLAAVFEHPTVAGLAATITNRLQAGELPPIGPAPRDRPVLASYGEQRLWFVDQLNPGTAMHNVQFLRRLRGRLDADVLERALREIVRRHEVLRTRFVVTPDGLTRVVDEQPRLPFTTVELAAGPPDERDRARRRLLAEHGGRPFDLAAGAPLRALLMRFAPDEHELLITVHHAVFDGPSVEVLSAELAELYPALRDGREPRLPELAVQVGDFAAWQRTLVTGELADSQLAYWRRQLAGLPPTLELRGGRPRPPRLGTGGAHVLFEVPAQVVDRLRAVGAEEGATLFMATLAGYVELLRRHTGREDLAVGVPLINRQRPELEHLIGFFVNTLVLRVGATESTTFRELLRRVRTVTIEAYTNADVPFEALVEALAPPRDPSVTPLVQTMFMLADDRRALPVDIGGVSVEFEPFGLDHAKFDLFLYLWRRPDGLTCAAEYRPELFDEPTVRNLTGHYTDLLAAAGAAPDTPLSALCLAGATRS